MKVNNIIFMLLVSWSLVSCSYLNSASKQQGYEKAQDTNPAQYNLKHMLERETYFVNGLIRDKTNKFSSRKLAVAAYSDQFTRHELVDITYFAGVDTHYALNLPAGEYDLLILTDKDNNGVFEQSEVIGHRRVNLKKDDKAQKVLTGFDLSISNKRQISWKIHIPIPEFPEIQKSLFYPQGTIRSLDDPIFGRDVASLGMYEPAVFMERAPTMFYALEEFLPYKVPVIFVHGMGGTALEFVSVVKKLDREHYVPWFFYYPSGTDLEQLAETFYRVFLSGELFPKIDTPMIIVAHSMGGLIMREVMNLYQGADEENQVALLITIASPLGGHPAAASSVNAPMVLPSWRDLNPDSDFIRDLYRKPLPGAVRHQLLYAYANTSAIKLGENSDGVVPLSSQLHPLAQRQSSRTFGFNNTHTGILKDDDALRYILDSIQSVKSPYPESHIKIMKTGGYDVELGDRYNDQEKYVIKTLGKYLAVLSRGEVDAASPSHQHFVKVMRGEASPRYFAEKTWLKFIAEYPALITP